MKRVALTRGWGELECRDCSSVGGGGCGSGQFIGGSEGRKARQDDVYATPGSETVGWWRFSRLKHWLDGSTRTPEDLACAQTRMSVPRAEVCGPSVVRVRLAAVPVTADQLMGRRQCRWRRCL